MNLLEDFISLLFPKTCLICGLNLFRHEELVCTRCFSHLPETNFHSEKENMVSRVFWGRVPLETASSLYFYRKGGSVQRLIHQMKYQGHREVGPFLGRYYGSKLKDTPHFRDLDLIVPIPLHRKKLNKRGFNQAALFASGLGHALAIPVDERCVVREVATSTQTKKSRYKRWENVREIFRVANPEQLEGKHVLLVDDVITTGATMEACLQAMKQVPGIRLSALSIAFAHD